MPTRREIYNILEEALDEAYTLDYDFVIDIALKDYNKNLWKGIYRFAKDFAAEYSEINMVHDAVPHLLVCDCFSYIQLQFIRYKHTINYPELGNMNEEAAEVDFDLDDD
jgi:hypothetical protein